MCKVRGIVLCFNKRYDNMVVRNYHTGFPVMLINFVVGFSLVWHFCYGLSTFKMLINKPKLFTVE